jgi:hypothetical protein
MHCPACQHRFTFRDSLKILSPYHCPCPACKAPLTLGKQADRFVIGALLLGTAATAAGIYLEQSHILSSAQGFATTAALLVLGSALGEWYLWKRGVLCAKFPRPT